MVRLFVRHSVNDFGTWKNVYDEFDRRQMGVKGDAVYTSVDDPNDVTVWHDFENEEKAREFTSSDRLRSAMAEGGVSGDPVMWYTRPCQSDACPEAAVGKYHEPS